MGHLLVVLSDNVMWQGGWGSNLIIGNAAVPLRVGQFYTFGVFLGSVTSRYGIEVDEVHDESIDEESHTGIGHEKEDLELYE